VCVCKIDIPRLIYNDDDKADAKTTVINVDEILVKMWQLLMSIGLQYMYTYGAH